MTDDRFSLELDPQFIKACNDLFDSMAEAYKLLIAEQARIFGELLASARAEREESTRKPDDAPTKQPCGAYLEPQWYRDLPESARVGHPWNVCSGVHNDGWHTNNVSVFATHHQAYVGTEERICACGQQYPHAGEPMDP